ncbi:MAG TPA: FapA family protein [Chitinispirillaceae bacterium]|nr:FapA family protein [Chitinispirillaceae bacterium]
MSEISVLHTPDGLRAFIQIPSKGTAWKITPDDLRQFLNRKGIIFGIINEALIEISNGGVQNRIEVARGIPPRPGVPGRIQMLVDTSGMGKPKTLSDGRVDHRDLGLVVNIKKGTVLARKIHPRPGTEGKNVFGKPIPVPPVSDVALRPGVGTSISEADPDLLVADIDGALGVDEEGNVEVRNEKVLNGDIDYSTGNITFCGHLCIKGSIRSGFIVETVGDLKVGGNIEDATVKCGGNLEVRGGAMGSGNGKIHCRGNFSASHIENFSVEADNDVLIGEEIMHSNVISGGKVRARQIIGGSVVAVEIDADVVGSSAETKTVLDVGRELMLVQERHLLLKELVYNVNEFVSLKQQVYSYVKDVMDENGYMPSEEEKNLEKLKQKIIEVNDACLKLQSRVKEIEMLQKNCKADPGVMIGTAYPNTLIKYGSGEKMITEKTERLVFHPGKKVK